MSEMYFEFKENHFSLWVSTCKLNSMEIVFLVTYLHMGYVTPDLVTGKLITLKNIKLYVCNVVKMLIDFNCYINHWSFNKILRLIFLKFLVRPQRETFGRHFFKCLWRWFVLDVVFLSLMVYEIYFDMGNEFFFHLQKWQRCGILMFFF